MSAPIPVICDRCRAEGLAGDDPFEAFGALLDFDPVPRLKTRPDGWDAECQRAFIAALSLTGSVRAAARAVTKSTFGAEQLRRAEGNESFLAAWDEAMAMAGDERSRRLAEGVRAVAAEQSGWRPATPPWSHAASRGGGPSAGPPNAGPDPGAQGDEEEQEKVQMELLEAIFRRFCVKLDSERRCRLEGRIAEADFYLRQITMLEVSLDVVSGDAMAILRDARRGGFDLLHIAETEVSKLFDRARRRFFDLCGDPPRPEYPPRHLLEEHEGFATEPLEGPREPGIAPTWAEQYRRQQEQYERDAEAQIKWEAEARRDYERRRATPPPIDEETAEAGQPAAEADRTEGTDSLRAGPSDSADGLDGGATP